MVTAAEMAADLLKTVAGETAGKVHANLARHGDALAAFFALQIGKADAEMPCNHVNNCCDIYLFFRGGDLLAERLPCQIQALSAHLRPWRRRK